MTTESGKPLIATNKASLEAWMGGQSREVVVAVATRAALRVAPLAVRIARNGLDPTRQQELALLTGRIFRALAIARVSAEDPNRTLSSAAREAAGAAGDLSVLAIVAAEVTGAAMSAASAAANSAACAAAATPQIRTTAGAAVDAFVKAVEAADANISGADAAAWSEVRSDIEAARGDDIGALLSAPLWRQREPRWVRPAVESLQAALPANEDWAVWINWYMEHLSGGPREGAYEIVFASVPQAEWDKGQAAANAWIREHLPPDFALSEKRAEFEIEDRAWRREWLARRDSSEVIAIAARVALRVLPIALQSPLRSQTSANDQMHKALNGAIFRAAAIAWVRARYPASPGDFDPNGAMTALFNLIARRDVPGVAAASSVVSAVTATFADSATNAFNASEAAGVVELDTLRDGVDEHAEPTSVTWAEIRADGTTLDRSGVGELVDAPLWSRGAPPWATDGWGRGRSILPSGEDWDVWIDWYEDRLRGGSRGEGHEPVFARVPQEEWDKGPAAANA